MTDDLWHRGPLIALDFEATGIDVETERIVTACIALIDGTGSRPLETLDVVINPGIEVPADAAAVHGWTTDRIRDHKAALDAREGVEFVAEMLARALLDERSAPLIGHNLGGYDLTLLDRELRRHQLAPLDDRLGDRPLHVVDTLVLCRRKSGTVWKHKLPECAAKYGVTWDEDAAHDSTYDAVQTARIAWLMADSDPRLAAVPLPDLHARQAEWKAAQDAEIAAYFKRKGRPYDGLDGHWPVRPYGPHQMRVAS